MDIKIPTLNKKNIEVATKAITEIKTKLKYIIKDNLQVEIRYNQVYLLLFLKDKEKYYKLISITCGENNESYEVEFMNVTYQTVIGRQSLYKYLESICNEPISIAYKIMSKCQIN